MFSDLLSHNLFVLSVFFVFVFVVVAVVVVVSPAWYRLNTLQLIQLNFTRLLAEFTLKEGSSNAFMKGILHQRN